MQEIHHVCMLKAMAKFIKFLLAEFKNIGLVGGLDHLDYFSIDIEHVIILTDFQVFQRGRLNHQPDYH